MLFSFDFLIITFPYMYLCTAIFTFIKADIKTEISPIMGSEKESEELVKAILDQFETDPTSLWQSNMFGKSLEVLVKEGLQNKLYKMPEDVQIKIQKFTRKI